MFEPIRSEDSGQSLAHSRHPQTNCLRLQSSSYTVTVGRDGFTIGTSRQCDLSLNDAAIPALHSIIHMQSGAIWIESANATTTVELNGRSYRRMALRHDDRLKIGSTEFTILVQPNTLSAFEQANQDEDLDLLTAEELCDRILSEQAMVEEFVEGRRAGWEALFRAIDNANREPEISVPQGQANANSFDESDFDGLLEQLQSLSRTINDRTQELDDHERQILESTALLEESQNRVAQQIEQLLEQLNQSDPPNELRASA
ncbi:FHA domain-containing protein [Schlesneria paludicola]|uniref:FHA domain-containing protein n=1 Tax=Schlesneria paludicola TaxID=360056 RepID=UPI00029AC30E|nr:FHA domain-containing protein [Schlesneria paludicola]